jgi:NADH:ubiquinone oxidoreductase subunit 5 (subunit L)/multisubunit Na+/H+ antiporter MnhA subunit
MLGFFGKIYLFFAGWADHQYLLVVVGLVTSVVSIYYYISVIKMMVVKEPQEASDVVKAYPAIELEPVAGMPALRAALVGCVMVTAVGGILSNPLFAWASARLSPERRSSSRPSPSFRAASRSSVSTRLPSRARSSSLTCQCQALRSAVVAGLVDVCKIYGSGGYREFGPQ